MRTRIPVIILLALMLSVTGCGAPGDKAAESIAVPEIGEIDNVQPAEETGETDFSEDDVDGEPAYIGVSLDDNGLQEIADAEEAEDSDDKSPFLIWEFEGYVDECTGYFWQDDFKNCDYDGDGITDRVKRQWDGEEQIAIYTVEFGNGDLLTVPKGWETGFPHAQGGDLDGDGQKEILFTLSYDTSTDPLSFGDMWLFDKDDSGKYSEVELPLAGGENGAKCFTIDYEKPEDLVIRYSIKEAGLSRSEEVDDDYINYWWTDESTSQLRSVYWAEIREGESPAIRCFVEPLPRSGQSLGFDLSYRNGKYEIGYVEIDAPEGF